MPLIDPLGLVLVAVMPSPRDLEIARLLGWYRIPLRSAPRLLAVDYLAFYLPASFGAAGGRVAYAAQVLGHELTTRRTLLKDEPDHPSAEQEYYKINLGGLIALPRPIAAAGWKRFAFIYTTGEYLLRAQNLSDLIIRSEDRSELWRSLRDGAGADEDYHFSDRAVLDEAGLLELLRSLR